MVGDSAPVAAPGGGALAAWWFRLVVRGALALLSFWMLSLAIDRYQAFAVKSSMTFSYDDAMWLSGVALALLSGFLFGLAAWLPFAKVRFLPSRLLLAILALVPVAHFWWTVLQQHGGGLLWLDEFEVQTVCAVLAGVAIASGFREVRSAATGSDPAA
jgi:hypothetical protein